MTIVAVIENLDDLTSERLGQMRSANVRKVEVSDALVDSGATGLLMPKHLIARLGMVPCEPGMPRPPAASCRCRFTAPPA